MKEKIDIKISSILGFKFSNISPDKILNSIGLCKIEMKGIIKTDKLEKILKIIEEKNEDKT